MAGIVSFGTILRIVLFPDDVEDTLNGSAADCVTQPLVLLCFTCAYGMRGLRLVILYDADIRARWGKLAKDRTMAKSLVIMFVLAEVSVWSANLAFGVEA